MPLPITDKQIKKDLMKFSKGELAERLIFAYNTISRMESKDLCQNSAQQPLSGSPEGSPKSAMPTSDNGKRCVQYLPKKRIL